jgi:nicotinate-nucleotide adenylyltransferase
MKTGLLGGTFDPIHLGHLLMAETARETLGLSQVLFVPAGDPPHKQSAKKTPAVHRKTMIELAIAGNPHFVLSRVDLDRPGPHYTTDTICLVRMGFSLRRRRFLIIGGDLVICPPGITRRNRLPLPLGCHPPARFPPSPADLEVILPPGLQARLDW